MKTQVNDNTVTINNKLTIVVEDDKFFVSGADLGISLDQSFAEMSFNDNRAMNSSPVFDPKTYATGENGLTLEASVERAVSRLEDQFYRASQYVDSYATLYVVVENLIADKYGRDYCYRLGGKIASGYRQGYFKGIPPEIVFELAASERIELDY